MTDSTPTVGSPTVHLTTCLLTMGGGNMFHLTRRWLTAGLVAISLVLLACRDESPTHPTPAGPAPSAAEVPQPPPVQPYVAGPLDRTFLSIAEKHPEFAGVYVDDGMVHVLTTTGEIPVGLELTVGLELRRPGPYVPVRADFSFEELARWYRVFVEALLEVEWVSTDIDERNNRLYAGVKDIGAARRALEAAGVPEAVYVLREEESPQLLKTLSDRFRPVPGGVEAFCTLGFNVEHWEFGRTFVTNSHCTDVFAEIDGKAFPQPDETIGHEVYDEPLFTGGPCPAGKRCRYSDAALVRYVSSVDYELGKVARTLSKGSKTIDDSKPRFFINWESTEILDGEKVNWIGISSGWREGNVNRTCRNVEGIKDPNDPLKIPSDLVLLCQYTNSAGAKPGDSGSPVFSPPDAFSRVILKGIIWGEEPDILDTDSWFSFIKSVRDELKPNTALACDGMGTTTTGGCAAPGGTAGSGEDDDCSNDPTAVEC